MVQTKTGKHVVKDVVATHGLVMGVVMGGVTIEWARCVYSRALWLVLPDYLIFAFSV